MADVRGRQIAVVADALLPRALDLLEAEGWGAIQLPPSGLDNDTVGLWLEQVAEHVAEFRRNDYAVVVITDGLYEPELTEALAALGVDPLSRVELTREALAQHAFQAPPAR
jgi:hypothetical protein